MEYAIEEIKKAVADKGMTGRLSTWPRPAAMMFIEAGAEYAIKYAKGEVKEKLDMDAIKAEFKAYAGLDSTLTPLVDDENNLLNYILVLMDFLNF